jgi:hypothetical protein
VYIIINYTSEEVDAKNNPVSNPQNLERGANHRAEGETDSAVVGREKVYLSVVMADDHGSCKPWHHDTSKFKEGSFNGVPVPLALAKETIATGKKQDKEKTRIS